jgi:hypothetical protein
LERHEPIVFEAAGADIRNWRQLALLTTAGVLRRWRRRKGLASLSTRNLAVESNHQGTPVLLDGEFHMMGRHNTIAFDPACGLIWSPRAKHAPW